MSEWITTGEMIDKLKIGEIAELEENAQIPMKYGPSYKHVFKRKEGDISWCKKDGTIPSSMPLVMYGHTTKWKWRILPNYVSFDEAMKALQDGKTVYYKGEYGEFNRKITPQESRNHSLESLSVKCNGLLYLYEGKWTIE